MEYLLIASLHSHERSHKWLIIKPDNGLIDTVGNIIVLVIES